MSKPTAPNTTAKRDSIAACAITNAFDELTAEKARKNAVEAFFRTCIPITDRLAKVMYCPTCGRLGWISNPFQFLSLMRLECGHEIPKDTPGVLTPPTQAEVGIGEIYRKHDRGVMIFRPLPSIPGWRTDFYYTTRMYSRDIALTNGDPVVSKIFEDVLEGRKTLEEARALVAAM